MISISYSSGDEPYQGNYPVTGGNDRYLLYHRHDWFRRCDVIRTVKGGFEFINSDPDEIFNRERNWYSYLDIIDKKTNKVLLSRAVPALSYLWISADSKYIVGLSEIKIDNPYHLIVMDMKGGVIHKDKITEEAAEFKDKKAFDAFCKKYAGTDPYLTKWGFQYNGRWYLNLLDGPDSEECGDEYFKRLRKHPYPISVARSVTNFIFWYYYKPDIKLAEENRGELVLTLKSKFENTIRIVCNNKPNMQLISKHPEDKGKAIAEDEEYVKKELKRLQKLEKEKELKKKLKAGK